MKDRKHGLSQTNAEVSLSLLRNCPHAEPEMSNDRTAFDHMQLSTASRNPEAIILAIFGKKISKLENG